MSRQLEELVARWVRPEIRALAAYHVPDATGLIKLDAMENPYGWPSDMVERWLATLAAAELNRYPDSSATELLPELRQAMDVPVGAELLLGNGSDEIIQMIALALAGHGRVLLAPEPSFVMYRMIAACCGMQYVGVPLRSADFFLDRGAMLAAIDEHEPAVIFLAYPNNPTGNCFDSETIEAIVAAAPGLVVIDEAYAPFAEATFIRRLAEAPNLLVMRTLSKLGLAGLRLGVLAGSATWLGEIDKIRLPYNINTLTQISARFALAEQQLFALQIAKICAARTALLEQLQRLPGVTPFPSRANFILFRVASSADAIYQALISRGVLIKNLNGAHPLLANTLRVTVGTTEENQAFLTALTASCS